MGNARNTTWKKVTKKKQQSMSSSKNTALSWPVVALGMMVTVALVICAGYLQ
jgi:hypothetical protein